MFTMLKKKSINYPVIFGVEAFTSVPSRCMLWKGNGKKIFMRINEQNNRSTYMQGLDFFNSIISRVHSLEGAVAVMWMFPAEHE